MLKLSTGEEISADNIVSRLQERAKGNPELSMHIEAVVKDEQIQIRSDFIEKQQEAMKELQEKLKGFEDDGADSEPSGGNADEPEQTEETQGSDSNKAKRSK